MHNAHRLEVYALATVYGTAQAVARVTKSMISVLIRNTLFGSRQIRCYKSSLKRHSTAEQEAVATWPVRFKSTSRCSMALSTRLFIGPHGVRGGI